MRVVVYYKAATELSNMIHIFRLLRSISGWWNSSYKTGNENIKLEVECNRNGKQYVKRHKARFKRKQILSM